jgi:hypothetical protein
MRGNDAFPQAIREVEAGDWRVRLDLAGQVLYLDTDEDEEPRSPLLPLLPLRKGGPVSAATLLLKAKQFDDGLYAAVELAAERECGRFPGKISLLRSLARTLTADPADADAPAAHLLLAACTLGGSPVPVSAPLQESADALITNFLRDEQQSKPLGFYTWTPGLATIFRRDRLLQTRLGSETADALARALDRTAGGWHAYEACLRLATRLTNPAGPGLRAGGSGRAFFPPSRSHEVDLFQSLFESTPIPEGFDLMDDLIRRVRQGKIRLLPREDSGWYDHQTWSLEPLIVPERMPESPRLQLGPGYRRHLEQLFRGALALTRETHVKQLGAGGRGGYVGPAERPIWIGPGLTVEPLPSLYRRRAGCYRLVRSVLDEAFGPEAWRRQHRLTRDGPCAAELGDELDAMERLFDGAASVASRELGLGPAPDSEAAERCFAEWRSKLADDADVRRDARMMVPVFYDEARRKTKVWAFLGWRTVPVDVNYRVAPAVLAVESANQSGAPGRPPPVQFCETCYEFAVPVMAEVYVEKLLDRDAFRWHCAVHRSRAAILANLR